MRERLARKIAAGARTQLHPYEGVNVPKGLLSPNPNDPAPRTAALVQELGPRLSAEALSAWNARLGGTPIVDIAHSLGLDIAGAKALLAEAHQAIASDLKETLEVNRTLDLDRIDQLLATYLPLARQGDDKAAAVVLKSLQHRAKLTGTQPQPDPGRAKPENVLCWIQMQLPAINKIVYALPVDQ